MTAIKRLSPEFQAANCAQDCRFARRQTGGKLTCIGGSDTILSDGKTCFTRVDAEGLFICQVCRKKISYSTIPGDDLVEIHELFSHRLCSIRCAKDLAGE